MKKFCINFVPWIITFVALYFVAKEIEWSIFWDNLLKADKVWLSYAVVLTFFSYFFRSYRWKYFFENRHLLDFVSSFKVLLLGFFMNNILPARTGELVRAHTGAKLAGTSRTLMLASIASERLVDGLTISLFFMICCFTLMKSGISDKLFNVSLAFLGVGYLVICVLVFRNKIYSLLNYFSKKHKWLSYLANLMHIFIEGLAPLCSLKSFFPVSFFSLLIWGIELLVFYTVSQAFSIELTLGQCIIFMVAVNFSSLIPAAPGGVGVIEAVTLSILMSLNFGADLPINEKRAIALGMILSQHVIQFAVVGIFGFISFILLKKQVGSIGKLDNE